MSTEEGEKKAIELDAMFIEVSAKSGYNIKTVSVATSVGWPIDPQLLRSTVHSCVCMQVQSYLPNPQLFRRVAAALPVLPQETPGAQTMPNTAKETRTIC